MRPGVKGDQKNSISYHGNEGVVRYIGRMAWDEEKKSFSLADEGEAHERRIEDSATMWTFQIRLGPVHQTFSWSKPSGQECHSCLEQWTINCRRAEG